MTTPHKWAEVIKAWADGKEIEFRTKDLIKSGGEWKKVIYNVPNFSSPYFEWRIATPKSKYRVALFREADGEEWTATADNDLQAEGFETGKVCQKTFVRWLTDWVEYDSKADAPSSKDQENNGQ